MLDPRAAPGTHALSPLSRAGPSLSPSGNDFTHWNSLGVTIGGRAYRHLLSHSGWRYAEVVAGETFLA